MGIELRIKIPRLRTHICARFTTKYQWDWPQETKKLQSSNRLQYVYNKESHSPVGETEEVDSSYNGAEMLPSSSLETPTPKRTENIFQ